jgi:tetratricopeptide (TPR) repeat protein
LAAAGNFVAALRDYEVIAQVATPTTDDSSWLKDWRPARGRALAREAFIYQSLGAFDKAIAIYTKMIDADAKDEDSFFCRGRLRLATGDLQQALEDLTIAVTLAPDQAEYRAARGKAELMLGKADEAITDLTTAIASAPTPGSYFLRAQAYRAKGNLDAALADLNETIKRDGQSSAGYFSRGSLLAANSDFEAALKDYDASIRLDSKNPSYYTMRGVIHGVRGELDKAIADYSAAILLDPTDAQHYNMRAWALLKAHRLRAALREANRALTIEPNFTSALATRAHIYEAMGEKSEAIEDYKKALANASAFPDAKESLARLGVQ